MSMAYFEPSWVATEPPPANGPVWSKMRPILISFCCARTGEPASPSAATTPAPAASECHSLMGVSLPGLTRVCTHAISLLFFLRVRNPEWSVNRLPGRGVRARSGSCHDFPGDRWVAASGRTFIARAYLSAIFLMRSGREVELRQRHAAVEDFRVVGNLSVLQLEPADAFEDHTGSLGVGQRGVVAETVAGIGPHGGGDRIAELPAEVFPAFLTLSTCPR